MKRFLITLVACLSGISLSHAQGYSPTTTWPYAYSEFQEGTLVLASGKEQKGQYNINMDDHKLHFLEDGYIKAAHMVDVLMVQIGTDVYQNVSGAMLKVLAKSDKSLVLEESLIDYAALNETGGAYGSSSTTIGTMSLSSLEGIGATNSSSNINHMDLKNQKENGKILSFNTKTYIFAKGYKVFAAKRDVLAVPGVDPELAKAFLKENKIKWNRMDDILKAGDFLADHLN